MQPFHFRRCTGGEGHLVGILNETVMYRRQSLMNAARKTVKKHSLILTMKPSIAKSRRENDRAPLRQWHVGTV